MNFATGNVCARKGGVSTYLVRRSASDLLVPRLLRTSVQSAAAPQGDLAASTSEPNDTATKPPTKPGNLAKEALVETLQTLKSEAVTARVVLGEDVLSSLRKMLGKEYADAAIKVLDGYLGNRRLFTVIVALVDVALVWVLIKVYRTTVMYD
ncbi:hypothetical protein VaNZ11_014857 [Volvox africanus]|uniref:Uncharacterized protein n=1 Tax=Volvox africanus TaxID=51714 RepID=A0ABQ5SKZ2_9CHLO|nr:hypothetical protein VaNZ11_014857 [Volvox africanus]